MWTKLQVSSLLSSSPGFLPALEFISRVNAVQAFSGAVLTHGGTKPRIKICLRRPLVGSLNACSSRSKSGLGPPKPSKESTATPSSERIPGESKLIASVSGERAEAYIIPTPTNNAPVTYCNKFLVIFCLACERCQASPSFFHATTSRPRRVEHSGAWCYRSRPLCSQRVHPV